jgi:hypothetical protein
MMKFQWILMADIIQSSDYEGFDLAEDFKSLVHNINSKNKKKLLSPLTITLGDEFQGIVKNLKTGLEVILQIEELLLYEKYHLRYVLYYGEIETPINPEIAYGMLGSGLSSARKMLETLKETERRFRVVSNVNTKSEALNDALWVYQNICSKWNTTEDKLLAAQFINFVDYKLVAEKMGVDRSQIWKKMKSLNISSYFAIRNIISYLSR